MSMHFKGKPFAEYRNEVNILVRMGRLDEAEKLLRDLINAIESQDKTGKSSAPAWYYASLANIYRDRGDRVNEKKILEAFTRNNSAETTLHERLEQLKAIKS